MNKYSVKEIDRHRAHDGHMKLDVVTLQHTRYDGTWSAAMKREVLVRRPAVAVLLHDVDEDCIVLVEQFRVGAMSSDRPWVTELVAGLMEPGEQPEEVAKRECEEETGLRVRDLHQIAQAYNSVGGTNELTTIFYGIVDSRKALITGGVPDENEDIKVLKVPAREFCRKLECGEYQATTLVLAGWWLRATIIKG